jgi:hypothetical protein
MNIQLLIDMTFGLTLKVILPADYSAGSRFVDTSHRKFKINSKKY